MPTILNQGKAVRASQRSLEKKQREALGMSSDTELNFDNAAIVFQDMCETVITETNIQKGKIETLEDGLEANSSKRAYYDEKYENNNKFIEKASRSTLCDFNEG